MVRHVQELLSSLGYNPGPVDGISGQSTRAAVERFQSDLGLTVDGHVSGSLISNLRTAFAARESSLRRRSNEKTADPTTSRKEVSSGGFEGHRQ